MSSKTRIIVLHMKEIIYTAVFLALAVVLAVVLFFMFGPGKNASHTASEKSRYKPGVYTSSITLNENTFDVEVTVNADRIKAIRLVNLNETTKSFLSSYGTGSGFFGKSDLFQSVPGRHSVCRRPEIYLPGTPFSYHGCSKKSRRTLKLSALRSTFRFQSSPAHPARSLHLHHLAF